MVCLPCLAIPAAFASGGSAAMFTSNAVMVGLFITLTLICVMVFIYYRYRPCSTCIY